MLSSIISYTSSFLPTYRSKQAAQGAEHIRVIPVQPEQATPAQVGKARSSRLKPGAKSTRMVNQVNTSMPRIEANPIDRFQEVLHNSNINSEVLDRFYSELREIVYLGGRNEELHHRVMKLLQMFSPRPTRATQTASRAHASAPGESTDRKRDHDAEITSMLDFMHQQTQYIKMLEHKICVLTEENREYFKSSFRYQFLIEKLEKERLTFPPETQDAMPVSNGVWMNLVNEVFEESLCRNAE